MDQLNVLEQKRLAIFKDYQSVQKKGILFIVGAVIIAFVSFITEVPLLFVPAVILAIVSFVFFGKAASHYSKFRTIIKHDLIVTLLKESFTDVTYDPHAHIPISTIMETGMVKRPDRYNGEDYIRGNYKGITFEVSDIDLKERVETRDSKGNVHVSYQTYFKGRWYIYHFERQFKACA